MWRGLLVDKINTSLHTPTHTHVLAVEFVDFRHISKDDSLFAGNAGRDVLLAGHVVHIALKAVSTAKLMTNIPTIHVFTALHFAT